jgi:tRNA(Arg) A34 adenosine deaminase TadA
MLKPNLSHMRAAIEEAVKYKTPFGASLAMGDQLFMTAANQTQTMHDPTAHAEVNAIRKLAGQLQKTDLSGFTLYSTCEPCVMCMSAAVWARIDTIFYGCSIELISTYMDQFKLKADDLNPYSFHKISVRGNLLTNDCKELLQEYA